MLLLLGFSASFAVSVGCKSIEAPALQTTTSRRAILAAYFSHSFEQPESNSGSNPTSMTESRHAAVRLLDLLRRLRGL